MSTGPGGRKIVVVVVVVVVKMLHRTNGQTDTTSFAHLMRDELTNSQTRFTAYTIGHWTKKVRTFFSSRPHASHDLLTSWPLDPTHPFPLDVWALWRAWKAAFRSYWWWNRRDTNSSNKEAVSQPPILYDGAKLADASYRSTWRWVLEIESAWGREGCNS